MKKLINLFITFFKIGLLTFGGGYAMISIIEDECVNKKNWIEKKEMDELIIISESTPGPIAINCATFVGYKVNKLLGGIIATLAISTPSLIIITLISIFLNEFKENQLIEFLFQGVRASVILLMILAFLNLSKHTRKNILFYTLLTFSFITNFIFNIKSLYIIIFAIIFSLIYMLLNKEDQKHA